MRIKAMGHACFMMTTQKGTKIVMDPFEGSVGYEEPNVPADIVTTSHGHYDHNHAAAVQGDPVVLGSVCDETIGDVRVYAVPCFHDEAQGAQRGNNLIFVFELEGLRIAHLGDLGHQLNAEQIEKIGAPDILLVPVGGIFTVDADGAKKVVDALQPKVVMPMHYQTERLTLGKTLGDLASFTKYFENVHFAQARELDFIAGDARRGVIVPLLP